jgi:uncharacterized protein
MVTATYRIGVVSDTHVPEFEPELPSRLLERFRGVDLILHAGDITSQSTLDTLGDVAPVVAVQGNHDGHLELPLQRVVEAGGVRIGLIHGHRGRVREFPGVAWNEAFAGSKFWWNGVRQHVLDAFADEPVDAVVFGHIHRPLVEWHDGRLLFNPGGTYHCQRSDAIARLRRGGPLHHRLYFISRARWPEGTPTAGLLTIRDGAIEPEVFALR